MAPKTKNTQKDDTATDTNAEPAVTTAAAADTSAPAADVNTGSAGEAGGDGDGTEPGPDCDDTDSGGDAKQDETPEERMSKLTGKVASVQNGRVAVTFLGPFSRYSRGDVACFDSAVAQDMVDRNIAVWAKDAERALQPNKDDDAHDTDIG
ncbi:MULTISPECIES: hypothetical protein [Enterobacter cloacae complex]|uniref:hypothetical protein n=1 Tax=Enterobacter cloacae complex TaxID=354276 RepID=UPI0027F0EF52|nr:MULTISPECIES: hypothetical protein [Enterobacter cloacae complex]MDQ7215639.1 hypothetical protein [Enterobacter cloacae]HCM9218081.1 hypothetical protein [Enterobacter kobei]